MGAGPQERGKKLAMRELTLDGGSWRTKDDLYDAFFAAVGAPSWHGRGLDSLNDSIATGSINAVEVPYRIVISNFDLISGEAAKVATDFVDLILEIAGRGCPVEIELSDSRGTPMPATHSCP
jgi:RNAse (barnase) inhibitor barstar